MHKMDITTPTPDNPTGASGQGLGLTDLDKRSGPLQINTGTTASATSQDPTHLAPFEVDQLVMSMGIDPSQRGVIVNAENPRKLRDEWNTLRRGSAASIRFASLASVI